MDDGTKWKITVAATVGGACAVFTAGLVLTILVCCNHVKLRKRAREVHARQMLARYSSFSEQQQATHTWQHDGLSPPTPWLDQPQVLPTHLPSTSSWTSNQPTFWPDKPHSAPLQTGLRPVVYDYHDSVSSATAEHSIDTTCSSAVPLTLTSGSKYETGSSGTFSSIPSNSTERAPSSSSWWLRPPTQRGHEVSRSEVVDNISKASLEKFFLSCPNNNNNIASSITTKNQSGSNSVSSRGSLAPPEQSRSHRTMPVPKHLLDGSQRHLSNPTSITHSNWMASPTNWEKPTNDVWPNGHCENSAELNLHRNDIRPKNAQLDRSSWNQANHDWSSWSEVDRRGGTFESETSLTLMEFDDYCVGHSSAGVSLKAKNCVVNRRADELDQIWLPRTNNIVNGSPDNKKVGTVR